MDKEQIIKQYHSYKKMHKRQGDFTVYVSSWLETVEALLGDELKPKKQLKKEKSGDGRKTTGGGSGSRSSTKGSGGSKPDSSGTAATSDE